MNPNEFKLHLKEMERKIGRFINQDAPRYAANYAAKKFKENFLNEGFFGERWKEVKRRQDSRNFKTLKSGKNKGVSKATNEAGRNKILTGTGNLRRSIKQRTKPGVAIVYSDTEYGHVHNEGLRAGRGTGFTMPKRQFMGSNPELEREIFNYLNNELSNIITP